MEYNFERRYKPRDMNFTKDHLSRFSNKPNVLEDSDDDSELAFLTRFEVKALKLFFIDVWRTFSGKRAKDETIMKNSQKTIEIFLLWKRSFFI